MYTEIFLDDHLYQTKDNFLNALDMDPILDDILSIWFSGYCQIWIRFPGLGSTAFSNPLHVTLGTLENCFSFSSIFGFSWSFSILDDVDALFSSLSQLSSWKNNKFFYSHLFTKKIKFMNTPN